MLFDFDLNLQMLVHKNEQQHNTHKISLQLLVQTFVKHNPNVLLHYEDIYHNKLMLEQIKNINIEKNLDKRFAEFRLNRILKSEEISFIERNI
jgi:hypothetical protein